MSNLPIFPLWCDYKNDLDLIDRLLTMYSLFKSKKEDRLRGFEKEVLVYYMKYGYNKETREKIHKELGKSYGTITQTNFWLKEKGYLEQSTTNFRDKKLNDDLDSMRKQVVEGKKKIVAVGFRRK